MLWTKVSGIVLLVGILFCGQCLRAEENLFGGNDLSSQEKAYLDSWWYAAKTADSAGEIDSAVLFYAKIVDYFPFTQEGEAAQKRIQEFGKAGSAKGSPVLVLAHELNAKERYYLRLWDESARLSEQINDYAAAIGFYRQINEYFPDTSEGVHALKRLKALTGGK